MYTQEVNQLFKAFHQMHHLSKALILANVWNVKSARVAEASGFEAMATSSGAIADSLGYKDGEQIPFAELLYIIRRIKSATAIPLSVDLERGYTDDLTLLNEHIQDLIDAGISGINIEDAQGVDVYLKKLNGIAAYLKSTSQQLFINARTDVFLQKLPLPVETVIERANLYQEAGADGLFVTGVSEPDVIKQIVSSTTLPVNVVATPAISVKALEDCGVRRISMAVSLYRSTYNNMEKLAKEILDKRSFEAMF